MAAGNPANQWAMLTEQTGPHGHPYIPSSYQFFEMMTSSDGTSTEMAGVDVVSGTQQTFGAIATSGHNVAIFRINIAVIDVAITNDGFGGISAFPNGIIFQHLGAEVGSREIIKTYTKTPIKRTGDWTWLAGPDADRTSELGQGEDLTGVRWTLTRGGAPCFMVAGEMFAMCLQDSTTGLTSFTAMAQGIQYPDQ